MNTFKYSRILFICITIIVSTQSYAQLQGLKKSAVEKVSDKCNSSHKSLNQYLQKLETKVEENSIASNSFKLYLKTADKHLLAIKKKCPKDNVSQQENKLITYKDNYQSALVNRDSDVELEDNTEESINDNTDRAYFESIYRLLSKIYSSSPNGADGTVLVKHGENTIGILNELTDFSIDSYHKKVGVAQSNDSFSQSEYYIKRTKTAIDDYDNFISKSRNTYNKYLADLTLFEVKGDPINELKELNETKAFCEILLKMSPTNTLAKQWKTETESKIKQVSGKIIFKSEMHKKYLGKMVFSKQPLKIGQEKESDIATAFKSGDYIYATIYLGTDARKLTDGYALNNCEVKINNYLVAPSDETGVWLTTRMQDSKVIQFAVLPDENWLNLHGEPYKKHHVNTHGNISQIIKEQTTNQIKVELELTFKGSGSKIKGSIMIN